MKVFIKKVGLILAILIIASFGFVKKSGFFSTFSVGNRITLSAQYTSAGFCSENPTDEVLKNASEIDEKPTFFLMGCGGFL